MRELLFVSDRLEDISKELGASSFSGFIEDTKLKVKSITSDNSVHIDVLHYSGASPAAVSVLKQLQDGAGSNTPYKLHMVDELTSTTRIFEHIFPAFAILVLDDYFAASTVLIQKLQKMAEPYKVALIINLCSEPAEADKFKRKLHFSTKPYIIDSKAIADNTLDELLHSVLEKDKFEKLNKLGYFNSVKPVVYFLKEILASENKTIQTRKQLNTQNTQITRKEEQGANYTEVQNNIRNLIQKSISDLEKMYRGKYEELNKPKIGRFSQIADDWTQSLQDFERAELAEKTERISIRITDDYKTQFVDNVSASIDTELSKDELFIRSSIDELLYKVNAQLQTKNLEQVKLADIDIPFPQKAKIIKSYCYIAKEYIGELIKPGMNEYFIALRDYIGVIMIAGSLLMPFQIIASVADEHTIFGFLKPFAKGIRLATAVITLALVIYGVYDLKKRIPLKREEEYLRELAKAKETLYNEAKRMFSDSSRDWVTNVSSWIRDINQNILNQIEKNMRTVNQLKISQVNTEKQQQQRLQQSIDTIHRSIQTAEKMTDMLDQKFREMIGETERDLKL